MTQWFSISIHFKIVTTISLVTICHNTSYYIVIDYFRTLYISYSWFIYFVTGWFFLLISLISLLLSPPPKMISILTKYIFEFYFSCSCLRLESFPCILLWVICNWFFILKKIKAQIEGQFLKWPKLFKNVNVIKIKIEKLLMLIFWYLSLNIH